MGTIRRSVTAAVVDDISHGSLLIIAFAVALVGVFILIASKCATNFAIAAGAILVLAGVAIAVPARARQARHEVTTIIRAIRGGSPTATFPPRKE